MDSTKYICSSPSSVTPGFVSDSQNVRSFRYLECNKDSHSPKSEDSTSEVTERLIFVNIDFQKLFIFSRFPTKRLQIELPKVWGDFKGTNFEKTQEPNVKDAEIKQAYLLFERLLFHAGALVLQYFMSSFYILVVQAKIRLSLGQH